jgi:sRNA-binding carbon storage regulator CsrA
MLVVTRKENEFIRIEPQDGIDPSLTLREAFSAGPILVSLVHVGASRVRLAIDAPAALRIGRGRQAEEEKAYDVAASIDNTAARRA